MEFRWHTLILWTVLLIGCAQGSAIGEQHVPVLQANEERRALDREIAVLRDVGGELAINEVAAPAMADRFVMQQRGLSLGFTRDVVWLRIALRRTADAPREWRLEAGNAVIDDYRFYGPDGAGGYRLIAQAGSNHPLASRDCRYRHPLFPVVLADTAPQVFYLRVESATSIALPLTLWQPGSFRFAAQSELLGIGGAFGVIAMAILSSLLGGLAIRSKRHLQLMACGLFFFEFLATALGLTAQYAFPAMPAVPAMLHRVNICLVPVVLLLLTRWALRVEEYALRLDAWCRRLTMLCVFGIFAVAGLGFRIVAPFIFLGVLLATALAVAASVLAGCQKRAGAPYFIAAAVGFTLPIAFSILTALGLIDGAALIELGVVLSAVSYCLFVQLGLLVDVKLIHEASLRTEAALAGDRALADQERQLRDEQTRFFAFVAHELRNRLAVVVSGIANLRVGLTDAGETTQQRVARVANAARRLAELIDRNLRLQRIAHPGFSPGSDACPPAFAVEQACAQIAEAHPGRRIDYTIADHLPAEIMIDAELVTLALFNLLDNAIKYSPPASPVTLTVRRDAAHPELLVYRISDCGPGIAHDDQHRLLDLAARPSPNSHAGFGVGLALVANVARCHGGSLECHSLPGAGATFELRLRIVLPPASETP